MKWHEALSGLISGTALLLPLTPAPGGSSPPGTHAIICTASKP
jgi:hypothetical protein